MKIPFAEVGILIRSCLLACLLALLAFPTNDPDPANKRLRHIQILAKHARLSFQLSFSYLYNFKSADCGWSTDIEE